MDNIKCFCCDSKNHEIVLRKGQHDQKLNLAICKDCGFLFLNPRKTKEEYNEYYINEYDKFYRPETKKIDLSSKTLSGLAILQRVKPYLSNIKNVLEIGSGKGYNLIPLKSEFKNAHFHVIEPSSNAKENLDKYNFHLISNDVDSNWNDNAVKYDLIILRHVLEHLLDPISVLKKIRTSLTENGILYIAVPNSYKIKAPIKRWIRIPHTFYFSKMSLQIILNKSGLKLSSPIIEGDKHNKNELYCISKKGDEKKPEISNNYLSQMKIILKAIKHEHSISFKIKTVLIELKNKLNL